MISENYHSLNLPVCDRQGATRPISLVELSPKDALWDKFRRDADQFAELYQSGNKADYAERIRQCANRLVMSLVANAEGELQLHLDSGRFCRVPRCPICTWRNTLKWEARVFKSLPTILEQHPDARFLFLTLTVKTCPLDELRVTLQDMNRAWARLTDRKQFPAIGWIRKAEVTRSHDDTAHPHFHCLLMVRPSYYSSKYYLSQAKWVELWSKSLRIDYPPNVHIKRADGKELGQVDKKAILETLKYCVKPEAILKPDVTHPTKNAEWLVTLTQQLHKMRMFSTGGVFKECLKDLENDYQDLIHINENVLDNETNMKAGELVFNWSYNIKKYIQNLE